MQVATVLTVYGIETLACLVVAGAVLLACCNSTYRLRYWNESSANISDDSARRLQQYLPFTVLKRKEKTMKKQFTAVATVLTVYGIETL